MADQQAVAVDQQVVVVVLQVEQVEEGAQQVVQVADLGEQQGVQAGDQHLAAEDLIQVEVEEVELLPLDLGVVFLEDLEEEVEEEVEGVEEGAISG